jgi:hypothetical protein
MSKIKIFTTVVLVAVIGAGVFYACQKEDKYLLHNSESNYSSMQKQQKWNVGEESSLSEGDVPPPFQYAFSKEKLEDLLIYTRTFLKNYDQGQMPGYCVFSSDNELIYYGFVTETSPYYDAEMFRDDPNDPFVNIDEIDPDGEDEDYQCYGKISTSNENRFDRWLNRQLRRGRDITIEYDGGVWKGTSKKNVIDDWKDPFQK